MTTPFSCPECKVGTLYLDEQAAVGERYFPKYYVRGQELPTRMRPAVVAFCNACEYCIEVK